MTNDTMLVRLYEAPDGSENLLCDDCERNFREEYEYDYAPPENGFPGWISEEDGQPGDRCEWCGDFVNFFVTEEQFDMAVEDMCELIGGSRSGVGMGYWIDGGDRYMVEVLGSVEIAFGKQAEIGGWVEIDEDRETVYCLIGLKIDETTIGDCEGFVGEYDPDRREWNVEWDRY